MATMISIRIQDHVYGTTSRPGTTYYPGQVLKGIVVLDCPRQQRIRTVHVAFIGECTTEYDQNRGKTSHTYTETVPLCNLKQSLFQGPFDIASQILQWPFEFTIPLTCSYTRVKGGEEGYIPNGESPLPPSFSWSSGWARGREASICYRLEVDVQAGGLLNNHKSQTPIVVRQFSALPPPDLNFAVQQFMPVPYWRSRELRTTGHTLTQKMKHAFTSDSELSTPTLTFRASVHFPRELAVDQDINMGISVTHSAIGPNDPVNPTLLLETLRLTLKSVVQMTVARGGFSSNDHGQGLEQRGELRLNFKPLKLPLDGEVVFLRKHIKLTDIVKGSPTDMVADFVTYTVKCRHIIKANAIIRHAETGHQFFTKTELPVQIRNAQEYMTSMSEDVNKQELLDTEDLPTYEDVVRSPPMSGVSVHTGLSR